MPPPSSMYDHISVISSQQSLFSISHPVHLEITPENQRRGDCLLQHYAKIKSLIDTSDCVKNLFSRY